MAMYWVEELRLVYGAMHIDMVAWIVSVHHEFIR
jgi:hypothetical protein